MSALPVPASIRAIIDHAWTLGDRDAILTYVATYGHEYLVRYARTLTRRTDIPVEDVVQQVWLKTWAVWSDTGVGPAALQTWLYNGVRFGVIDHARSTSTRRRICPPAAWEPERWSGDDEDAMRREPHDPGASVEDRVTWRAEASEAVDALQRCRMKGIDAVALIADGLTYAEAAQALGLSKAGLKSRILRVRRETAARLEGRTYAC